MPEELDFERAWLHKLSTGLKQIAGEHVEREVMQGAEALSSDSPREVVIAWTRQAMGRLDSLVEESDRRAILTGCACQYPKDALLRLRKTYQETEDLALVHRMLQQQFESLLRDTLRLGEDTIRDVAGRGWGSAGVLEGHRVVATKIPKSGHLLDYLAEQDPAKRRQLYCHCPRVREILKSSVTISPTYCYCGAGFYKGIWEEILGEPVEVELLESVLQGDEVCRFAIHLASGL
jgi:predicted hydrocarbon binding protein